MPSSVNLSRFNRGFERLFNIKGGPSITDIEPTIHLELSLALAAEDRVLFGIESFAAGSNQGAVAANKSAAMIRNPLGSNVVATLEKISFAGGGAESVLVMVAGGNPADLATAVPNHTRADPRGRTFGSCVCSQDAPAVDPGTGFLTIADVTVPTGISTDVILSPNQEIVLLPQIALRIVAQTVNQSLQWTFFYRERPLDQSELT